MNLSLRRKKSAESNKIDKAKPSIKSFKQIYQENKNRPLTKNEKRGWAILGGIIIAILVIAHVSNVMEQSRLEKDNVPIVISDVEDNIKLDYYTDRLELSAKISGVSSFAEVKVSGDRTDIHDRKNAAGNIKYEVKNIKEGDGDISISVVDGKRHSDKTVKFHRQTKADHDKQEEAAAAIARQQQQSRSQPVATPRQTAPSPQPASSELNFSNCKEARAAGYSHMRRGEPGYAPHLDRDGDGVACDKHR